MSQPFGNHPTLAQYLNWAREQGCTVQSGYQTDEHGQPIGIIRVVASGGRWLILPDLGKDEYLVPTTIARFDRRLGMRSPFFSVDPDDPYGSRSTQP